MIMDSNIKLARIAGILYLLIVLFGLIAQIFVRDNLVDYANATITANNILNSESWYRFGFVSELLMLICDVAVAVILFIILKDTNKNLAILTIAFRFSSIIILSVIALSHYTALSFLSGSQFLNVFTKDQLDAFALFSVKIHGVGYNISLLFFGIHLVVLGILIKKSIIFPKLLGILLFIGGLCYIGNSIIWFQFPDWVKYIYPLILLPSALGEWIFCGYLIIKGMKLTSEQMNT
jgi:Domain of unknown function (DUF4386)